VSLASSNRNGSAVAFIDIGGPNVSFTNQSIVNDWAGTHPRDRMVSHEGEYRKLSPEDKYQNKFPARLRSAATAYCFASLTFMLGENSR